MQPVVEHSKEIMKSLFSAPYCPFRGYANFMLPYLWSDMKNFPAAVRRKPVDQLLVASAVCSTAVKYLKRNTIKTMYHAHIDFIQRVNSVCVTRMGLSMFLKVA